VTGFNLEGDDAVDAREIRQQRRPGRLGDPADP
jgi:hypothetical protein